MVQFHELTEKERFYLYNLGLRIKHYKQVYEHKPWYAKVGLKVQSIFRNIKLEYYDRYYNTDYYIEQKKLEAFSEKITID